MCRHLGVGSQEQRFVRLILCCYLYYRLQIIRSLCSVYNTTYSIHTEVCWGTPSTIEIKRLSGVFNSLFTFQWIVHSPPNSWDWVQINSGSEPKGRRHSKVDHSHSVPEDGFRPNDAQGTSVGSFDPVDTLFLSPSAPSLRRRPYTRPLTLSPTGKSSSQTLSPEGKDEGIGERRVPTILELCLPWTIVPRVRYPTKGGLFV